MQAKFTHYSWENQAGTIASFYFEPRQVYRYEAGQYAVLSVPHDQVDSRGDSRTMTLSSSPDEPLLRFTMRLSSEAGSSFKQALLRLLPGSDIAIFDAMGDMVLPLDTDIPLLYIAGGVGIASYTGMIKSLLASRDKRQITVLYAVNSVSDIALQEPFQQYNQQYGLTQVIYTSDVNNSNAYYLDSSLVQSCQLGRLDGTAVLSYIQPRSLIYISGPKAMVEMLRVQLDQLGISSQQIIFDYFDGYTSL